MAIRFAIFMSVLPLFPVPSGFGFILHAGPPSRGHGAHYRGTPSRGTSPLLGLRQMP